MIKIKMKKKNRPIYILRAHSFNVFLHERVRVRLDRKSEREGFLPYVEYTYSSAIFDCVR